MLHTTGGCSSKRWGFRPGIPDHRGRGRHGSTHMCPAPLRDRPRALSLSVPAHSLGRARRDSRSRQRAGYQPSWPPLSVTSPVDPSRRLRSIASFASRGTGVRPGRWHPWSIVAADAEPLTTGSARTPGLPCRQVMSARPLSRPGERHGVARPPTLRTDRSRHPPPPRNRGGPLTIARRSTAPHHGRSLASPLVPPCRRRSPGGRRRRRQGRRGRTELRRIEARAQHH